MVHPIHTWCQHCDPTAPGTLGLPDHRVHTSQGLIPWLPGISTTMGGPLRLMPVGRKAGVQNLTAETLGQVATPKLSHLGSTNSSHPLRLLWIQRGGGRILLR
jgi:hypothetical protein